MPVPALKKFLIGSVFNFVMVSESCHSRISSNYFNIKVTFPRTLFSVADTIHDTIYLQTNVTSISKIWRAVNQDFPYGICTDIKLQNVKNF